MATITYLQKYINKETGLVAYCREQVLEIGGSFFGCRERQYGFGAEQTVTRLTKPYKSAKAAEKALEKIQSARAPVSHEYALMATSRW